jgi:hypothetical protein
METNATRILARPVQRTSTGGETPFAILHLTNVHFLSAEVFLAYCFDLVSLCALFTSVTFGVFLRE